MHLALITIKFSETKRLLLIYLIRVTTFFMFAVYFFSLFYLEEKRGFASDPTSAQQWHQPFWLRLTATQLRLKTWQPRKATGFTTVRASASQ